MRKKSNNTIKILRINLVKPLLYITAFSVVVIFIWQIFIYQKQVPYPFPYNWCLFWGTFEGSFLLFLCFFCLISSIAAKKNDYLAFIFLPNVLALFTYLLLFSNPFEQNLGKIKIAPILQDTLMIWHPPFLYAGFASTIVPYGQAITSSINYFWARLSWMLLTIGLGLGSLWAYLELGWGGFWFWDPVENLALIPWLLMTAYIHSMKFQSKLNIPLATCTFLSSHIALFLIRSGLLNSLHRFALDMEKSLSLGLTVGTMIIFSSFLAYKKLKKQPSPVTKFEGTNTIPLAFVWQNFFLIFGAIILLLTIIIPILYPTLYFGVNFYQNLYLPVLSPLLILLVWYTSKRLWINKKWLVVNLLVILVVLYLIPNLDFKGMIALILGISIIVSHLYLLKKNLPMILAHLGLGIMIIGIVLSTYLEQTIKMPLSIGNNCSLGPQIFTVERFDTITNDNYLIEKAIIKNPPQTIALTPKRSYYLEEKIILPEPSVSNNYLDHYYSVLEAENKGQLFITISHKPYINFLWGGIILMILGVAISLRSNIYQCIFHIFLYTCN